MRIVVIRLGESEADILNVHEGRADFNLTEKGHEICKCICYNRTSKVYCIVRKTWFC